MTIRETLLATAVGLALLASPALAGGPIIVLDDAEVIVEKPRSGGWVLPAIIGLLIVGALASGGGDDAPVDDGPEPCVFTGEGC